MSFNEKVQAFLIARYYARLVQSFGPQGRMAFILGTQHYGMQRGQRMAQRRGQACGGAAEYLGRGSDGEAGGHAGGSVYPVAYRRYGKPGLPGHGNPGGGACDSGSQLYHLGWLLEPALPAFGG